MVYLVIQCTNTAFSENIQLNSNTNVMPKGSQFIQLFTTIVPDIRKNIATLLVKKRCRKKCFF